MTKAEWGYDRSIFRLMRGAALARIGLQDAYHDPDCDWREVVSTAQDRCYTYGNALRELLPDHVAWSREEWEAWFDDLPIADRDRWDWCCYDGSISHQKPSTMGCGPVGRLP
ncbi:MAG: hypothetical protein AABY75_05525 [Bacteroidota bacterium]